MKESIIITIINAIKDIAIAIFNVFHKSKKTSTEMSSKKTNKTSRTDNEIEIPPTPQIIEAEPVDKTIITNRFIASDSELENMDINNPKYFEEMGARLAMSRPSEDIEILQ